jgi:hypothetical protein
MIEHTVSLLESHVFAGCVLVFSSSFFTVSFYSCFFVHFYLALHEEVGVFWA